MFRTQQAYTCRPHRRSFLQTAISQHALSYSYTGGWAAVSAAQATCDEKRSSVYNSIKL